MVVPFPPGGGTDAFARPLFSVMSKNTGKQFVIDNKGGAGGTVGASLASRAAPDGYTFFMHPLALGSAIAVTLLALLGVTHLGGNAGAYHLLARVSDQVAQQVVVVGHRVTQTVEIIGRKLRKE